MKNEIIQVSFKGKDFSDAELWIWLQEEFEMHGSKSGYIKSVLKEKMKTKKEEASKKDTSV